MTNQGFFTMLTDEYRPVQLRVGKARMKLRADGADKNVPAIEYVKRATATVYTALSNNLESRSDGALIGCAIEALKEAEWRCSQAERKKWLWRLKMVQGYLAMREANGQDVETALGFFRDVANRTDGDAMLEGLRAIAIVAADDHVRSLSAAERRGWRHFACRAENMWKDGTRRIEYGGRIEEALAETRFALEAMSHVFQLRHYEPAEGAMPAAPIPLQDRGLFTEALLWIIWPRTDEEKGRPRPWKAGTGCRRCGDWPLISSDE